MWKSIKIDLFGRFCHSKKKDVILPHISVKEIFEEKKMYTFGYALLWPNGPCFLLDRFIWYLWGIEKGYESFRPPPKKSKKGKKKRKIWNFVKKSKFWKNHDFSKSLPFVLCVLLLPFWYFFVKNRWIRHMSTHLCY